MAFLPPANLQQMSMTYRGALDALTDVVIGHVYHDIEIFYITVIVDDANDTFTETDFTLEWEVIAGGSDTVIDVITVAANTVTLNVVDADSLTDGTVPGGSRILMTVEDVATGADGGVTITFWYVPTDVGHG